MNRKVRHPYQILEAEELIVGNRYAFVSNHNGPMPPFIHFYVFGGIIEGDSSTYKRSITTPPTVTVHLDGKTSRNAYILQSPTLMYWREPDTNWDCLATFLGPQESDLLNLCSIVVPEQRWNDDPKIHVLDWENPNDIIERKIDVKDNDEDWEAKINVKRDAVMARAFGF